MCHSVTMHTACLPLCHPDSTKLAASGKNHAVSSCHDAVLSALCGRTGRNSGMPCALVGPPDTLWHPL